MYIYIYIYITLREPLKQHMKKTSFWNLIPTSHLKHRPPHLELNISPKMDPTQPSTM